MAGNDVRIVGANNLVKDGVAFVTNHELWVRLSSVAPGILFPPSPPKREAFSLFTSQVFNNVNTDVTSTEVDLSLYRYAVVYLNLTRANNPTNIRIIAQMSTLGVSWFDWAVDQWVDLRYARSQIAAAGGTLVEAIPLNYPIGSRFRLRAVAAGTTAANTFTLSATVEGLT